MPVFLDQRVLQRIRAEYLEMPGMKLTAGQLQRFCGIEQTVCKPILDALVKTGFRCLRHDGTYVRLTEGECLCHARRRLRDVRLFHRAGARPCGVVRSPDPGDAPQRHVWHSARDLDRQVRADHFR